MNKKFKSEEHETEKFKAEEPETSQDKDNNSYGELRTIFYKYKKRSTQHVTSSSTWVSQLIPESSGDEPVPYQVRKQLKTLAQRIHNDDLEAYKLKASKHERFGNKDFHKALLTHGTTKDKIAAYMYKIMESPVYTVNELFSLLDFVNVNNKGCHKSIVDIASVFETSLLPNKHVAREFECHNFMTLLPLLKTHFEQVEKQLVLWYFEDQVHLAYLKFLENIEKLLYDTQVKVKSAGAKGFQNVFKNHPRQDTEVVLQKLVNKLGDKNKSTKGLVLHILTNIQHDHHNLKITLISIVEEFLHRANVGPIGQYSGLCFLKDVVLSNYDDGIAEKLVKIYFDFFEMCSKKGEVDSRFMATILRGINRAYPYLKVKNLPFLEKQMETLYKLCHYVNFTVGTQALQLVYQLQSSSEDVPSDRFYTVIYDKLLDPEFGSSSFKSAFLNIVFRAMVADNNRSRICAFLRRLLQISRYHPSEVASGVLFLISETVKDNTVLKKDIYSLLMTGYDNKNNKTIKMEDNILSSAFSSDDENEYYSDLDTDGEENEMEKKPQVKKKEIKNFPCKVKNEKISQRSSNGGIQKAINNKSQSSWVHKDNWQHLDIKQEIRTKKYEANIRNPLYCGADLLPIWELAKYKNHFHPTVSLFASQLLDQVFVEYSGDPLEDLSLTRFLNRFVQRNPKKIKLEKNKIGTIFGSKCVYAPKGARNMDISGKDFKNLNEEKVAPEDVFLHKYFREFRKEKEEKGKKRKRRRTDSDDEDSDDDLFDKILKKKMSGFGELGGDDEEELEFDYASKIGAVDDGGSEHEDENEDMEDDDEDNEFGSDGDFEEFNSKSENINDEDEGDDFDMDEDFGSDDFDEFGEEEEEEDTDSMPSFKKEKGKTKEKSWGDWNSKLVDADEISHLFEENDKFAGTSEAVQNKDKSHAKQLKWESNRYDSKKKHFKGNEKPRLKAHKGKKKYI